MKYARPPFPRPLFARFCALALKLGYTVRGHRWRLLEIVFDYVELHPELFRNRP